MEFLRIPLTLLIFILCSRRGNDHLADHKKSLEDLRKALEVAEETRVKELVKKHTSEMETLKATCEEEVSGGS